MPLAGSLEVQPLLLEDLVLEACGRNAMLGVVLLDEVDENGVGLPKYRKEYYQKN